MSTAPEPTEEPTPRSPRVSRAVSEALATWKRAPETSPPSGPPRKKKKLARNVGRAPNAPKKREPLRAVEPPPPQPAEASTSDERVAYIDELLASPLGQAWIQDASLATPTAPEGERRPGVVAPLPRRKLIAADTGPHETPAMFQELDLHAGFFAVVLRVMIWVWGYSKYHLQVLRDVFRGQNTIKSRARHFRLTLESLGPTFVKLGQQLSLRADILPYEYCEELSEMLDRVQPFPAEEAIAIIERSLKRPITEVFEVFDPNPIGSASLSCVYQALLRGGEKVAVKVRRPKIQRTLAADLTAFGWLTQFAEFTSLIRSGMTRNLRYELSMMLLEETDFRREARYTELFRQEAEKSRQNYLGAPKVYHEISTDEVLVTEFISGVFLSEVMGALDRGDEHALQQIRERGVDPKRVAENLVMAFNWETLENVLFHADPHPANIVVRPDNSVAFIDFGSCGRFGSRNKRLWRQFHAHLASEDVYGMTEIAVAMLEPLPPVDLDSFKKEVEALYWDWLYAMKSDSSKWWEKASGVMWMKFIALSRKYNVPVNIDTLKGLRVTFLFDTIVFRLWRDLDLSDEYKRYHKKAGQRSRKRVQKAWTRRLLRGPSKSDYMKIEEALRMGEQIAARVQRFLDTPSHNFSMAIDKAYYMLVIVLQVVAYSLAMHVLIVLGLNVYSWITGVTLSFWDTFFRVVSHPLYQVLPLMVLVVLIRKVVARLRDYDP